MVERRRGSRLSGGADGNTDWVAAGCPSMGVNINLLWWFELRNCRWVTVKALWSGFHGDDRSKTESGMPW
ncbi:hypothetical protein M0R45_001899 [Rubus argutus]|uniref:Uncharacterized protein n=1 Tax=Rubus argutus TaxID=59490 RepID=A0AAW1VJT5_RUBAR